MVVQQKTVKIVSEWGARLRAVMEEKPSSLTSVLQQAEAENRWFTQEAQLQALSYWSNQLEEAQLSAWLSNYSIALDRPAKKIALILAGNIPLVGFHDLLCVLVAGHEVQVKLSSQDKRLLPYLIDLLSEVNTTWADRVSFTEERLEDFDAVIATGSNNTSRYFEYYFKDKPRIIRRNRHSVAILSGKESEQELQGLSRDLLDYFGLGCRSVSKIWVPKSYDFEQFANVLESFKGHLEHNKFSNNFHYHRTVFLMNQIPFREFGPLLLLEKPSNASALSTLHFEYYDEISEVNQRLSEERESLQCIACSTSVAKEIEAETVLLGQTQNPQLNAYADGIDTMAFLTSLDA